MMFRTSAREFWAEFLGTFVLMIFGLAVNAQVTLGRTQWDVDPHGAVVQNHFGDWFSINVGWGLAVTMGVYVAGGISGAHINPAVTLALAVRRRLAWQKVLPYMSAQLAGAFVASALVYAVYLQAIDAFEVARSGSANAATAPRTMATAGIWGTYPRVLADGSTVSNLTGWIDQIVATGLLLLCIFALSDKRNTAPKSNLGPLAVGAVVLLIGMTFGFNCGYAINPARDLAPRLFTCLAGWGTQVFTAPNSWWWLVPVLGPCLGGIAGAVTYDLLITRLHAQADDRQLAEAPPSEDEE